MAPRDDRESLLDALAVTAELTGTELSKPAARIMAEDLQRYPIASVLQALSLCRRELRGRLTISAVLERLDDGRPGPNEAWAMIPQDEAGSVVWTQEMAEAFGSALPLLEQKQVIAARSAFLEHYEKAISHARGEMRPAVWTPSLGSDKRKRAEALEHAHRKGRITQSHMALLLPPVPDNVLALPSAATPMPEKVRLQLAQFTAKLRGA